MSLVTAYNIAVWWTLDYQTLQNLLLLGFLRGIGIIAAGWLYFVFPQRDYNIASMVVAVGSSGFCGLSSLQNVFFAKDSAGFTAADVAGAIFVVLKVFVVLFVSLLYYYTTMHPDEEKEEEKDGEKDEVSYTMLVPYQKIYF